MHALFSATGASYDSNLLGEVHLSNTTVKTLGTRFDLRLTTIRVRKRERGTLLRLFSQSQLWCISLQIGLRLLVGVHLRQVSSCHVVPPPALAYVTPCLLSVLPTKYTLHRRRTKYAWLMAYDHVSHMSTGAHGNLHTTISSDSTTDLGNGHQKTDRSMLQVMLCKTLNFTNMVRHHLT